MKISDVIKKLKEIESKHGDLPCVTNRQECEGMTRAEDLLRDGGDWLAAVRRWVQQNCINGSSTTWASDAPLNPPITMKQLERVAAVAIAAALNERKIG